MSQSSCWIYISLAIHTFRVGKKLLLSLLSIESSLPSEKGGGDQHNDARTLEQSVNPHNLYNSDAIRNLITPYLRLTNQVLYVAGSMVTHEQTHLLTHRTTTVPLAHAPRVNEGWIESDSYWQSRSSCYCYDRDYTCMIPSNTITIVYNLAHA
jgi:hypothetical protein